MRSLTLQEIVALMRSASIGKIDAHMPPSEVSIAGVCVDSRLLKPKDLFFALPGAQVDGHEYLSEVASKGAIGAVVLETYAGPSFGMQLIKVADTLNALQGISKILLKKSRSKVIAVTGSVGKTTTKEFIAAILKEKYLVSYSPGNSNSKIGLPLAIINHITGKEDYLILEMGMTHSGQIAKLLEIAPPYMSVLTSVDYAHACNFSSLDEIARAKAEIFLYPSTVRGFLPTGIANFEEVMRTGSCPKTTYALSPKEADFVLRETPTGIAVGTVNLPPLVLPGKHNLHNLTAAIALARALEVEWELIAKAIPKLTLYERRLQFIEKSGVLFVNDSYNASPVAVKAALDSLPTPKGKGKKIAVLGDMLELGDISDRMHREVGEVSLSHVDRMFCFGECCKPIEECWVNAKRPVALFTEFEDLVAELKRQLQPGDVVLLKGSRRMGLWRVLDAFEGKNS